MIFGILGVQLFKGAFYYCEGPDIKNVRNKTDCMADKRNVWLNRKYNFDDLGKALMSLFVLSSRDGWVNIMYTGLDAVGVDQQVKKTRRTKINTFLSFHYIDLPYINTLAYSVNKYFNNFTHLRLLRCEGNAGFGHWSRVFCGFVVGAFVT